MSKVKLLIEIDEDYYEAVKKSVDIFKSESFYPFVLIANGIVITDDMISRKWLQCQIEQCEKEPDYQHENEDWRNGLCLAETFIDEAPTIGGKDNEGSISN